MPPGNPLTFPIPRSPSNSDSELAGQLTILTRLEIASYIVVIIPHFFKWKAGIRAASALPSHQPVEMPVIETGC
jgi:hypothetical protein